MQNYPSLKNITIMSQSGIVMVVEARQRNKPDGHPSKDRPHQA